MKKVVLIGASDSTAKEIISRLLAQDNVRLTLFLRHAGLMKDVPLGRVMIAEGDATCLTDLRRAIREQDIVISTMGGWTFTR